jgi:hypothetical protein
LLRMNTYARQAQQTYKDDKSQLSQGIISKKVFMIRVGCLSDGRRVLRNVSWQMTLVVVPNAIIRRLSHERDCKRI